MKCLKIYFSLLLLFNYNFIFSQLNITQESVSSKLADYYKFERENIHLHLNKVSYITTETIWFKGYIIEKKIKSPYSVTSNVFINFLDSNGNKISNKLFYAENSTFQGTFKLDESLKTGKYYLQVYTNFMNNFSEDESSVFEVNIINPNEKNTIDDTKINYDEINAVFYPESGTFLEGISNNIALKLTDCNDKGILIKDIEIVNSKNESITTFSTDSNGYGRITIIPEPNEKYKAILNINETKIEKQLPIQSATGAIVSINNFGMKDKTVVTIKTNATTSKNNQYSLVINQNDEVSVIPITLANENQKTIAFENDKLAFGLNTFSLIDSEGKKTSERIIYNTIKKPSDLEFMVNSVQSDSIVISGKSSLLMGNLSISILPENNTTQIRKTIFNSFEFDNYLDSPIKNINYYLTDFTRAKQFELDNVLITKTSKYAIDKALLNENPNKKFEFDNGLTIVGSVNNNLDNASENYSININSFVLGLSETTKLNAKNQFRFENVLAIDSTAMHFSLLDRKAKTKDLNVTSSVQNNKREFYKPFKPNTKTCIEKSIVPLDDLTFPAIEGAYILKDVIVQSKKKEDNLTNTTRFNNASSRGYKITDGEASKFRDVLSFIRSHGYNVSENGADVIISRTYTTTLLGNNTPVIYLDDFPLEQFSLLRNMLLSTIDEIYINKTGFGAGINGSNGVIRIYSKPVANGSSNIKIKSKAFYITNGFQQTISYTNPKFTNVQNDSFKTYGTIHWVPNINTDANGDFKFSIPNLYQKTIKIIIEGISTDGKLLSEVKTIALP
jgi:hypothetical protein